MYVIQIYIVCIVSRCSCKKSMRDVRKIMHRAEDFEF